MEIDKEVGMNTDERASLPPMDPRTSEASDQQLKLAREQGDAYGRALEHMTTVVADDGGEQVQGHYRIGYAIEKAEGMYAWQGGKLIWHAPEDENVHVEVSVRDAADGRFIPAVRVTATLVDPDGNDVGTHERRAATPLASHDLPLWPQLASALRRRLHAARPGRSAVVDAPRRSERAPLLRTGGSGVCRRQGQARE